MRDVDLVSIKIREGVQNTIHDRKNFSSSRYRSRGKVRRNYVENGSLVGFRMPWSSISWLGSGVACGLNEYLHGSEGIGYVEALDSRSAAPCSKSSQRTKKAGRQVHYITMLVDKGCPLSVIVSSSDRHKQGRFHVNCAM